MSTNYEFKGWMGLDKYSIKGQLKYQAYEPKTFEETDVDIKITHCGICASDLHTLRSGWGPTLYPCVVGHEIVGHAVRVGSKAEKGIKIGDRVGVGAQSASCLKPECEECTSGLEQHCQVQNTVTYNSRYTNGDKSYGGYADYWRGPSHFVFKIPDALPSDITAPMLCGGVTAFSPLQVNGAGPGKKVGIVGIGGLGHYGLMFAKEMGCDEVVAISRSSGKKEDAMKMGATGFIATDEDKDWARHHANSLDLIVSTVSSPKMPLEQYLTLLRVKGQFIQIGAPEDKLPPIAAFSLMVKGCKIGGSSIGSPKQIEQMLELAANRGIKTWNQNRPMKECNQAVVDMEAGKARYRYVLVNEEAAKL
jgi:alcohol dehydrogenase (NADP+)